MTGPGWIVIVDWDKFQHYKNREVPWIKNYTRLLADPNYLMLTPHQRGVLHGLWLLYAESGCQVVDSTATVSRQLCGSPTDRITRATLEALNHAGFIEFSSRQPSRLALADSRARGEGETEREEETETKDTKPPVLVPSVSDSPSVQRPLATKAPDPAKNGRTDFEDGLEHIATIDTTKEAQW